MADSVATRVARHRAKKRENGVTRLTLELDRHTVNSIRRLCKQHSKTRRQLLELAVHAADGLLAGRLQVAKAAAKAPTRIVARPTPQERPQALGQVTSLTNTPPPPEKAPAAPPREPTQAIDDADARIRAAAFVVEP